jgi:hypothetical protein
MAAARPARCAIDAALPVTATDIDTLYAMLDLAPYRGYFARLKTSNPPGRAGVGA